MRFDVHRAIPGKKILFLSYFHCFKFFDTKDNLLLNKRVIIPRQEKRKVLGMMFLLFFRDKSRF